MVCLFVVITSQSRQVRRIMILSWCDNWNAI